MLNDGGGAGVRAGRVAPALQRVLRHLPMGGLERQAIEAGEIDAVIDYGNANVIVFPAARRVLRKNAERAIAAERKALLEIPDRNGILGALPREHYRRLLPAFERVMLECGDVLHEPGSPVRHVYFPVDCVIGLFTIIDDRRSVATGLVGHEGMVGLSLALGAGVSSVRAVVQVPGAALRMPAARFTSELHGVLQLQFQLYRFAQVKLNQARQIAACVASHGFEQRLASWLLMLSERARSKELFLTQEHLACDLNVRRVSVTLACSALRLRGLISYHRGRLSILDRKGLESVACRCHRAMEGADVA